MSKKLSPEEQRIKDEWKRRHGILPAGDLIGSFQNADNGTTLAYKQLAIAMSMLLVLLVFSTIEAFFVWPGTRMPLYIFIFPVLSVGVFNFNCIVLKEEIGTISKYSNIFLLLVFSIFAFFTTGGVSGVATQWFIFLVVFTAMVVPKRWRLLIMIVHVIVFMACVCIGFIQPELITEVDSHTNNVLQTIGTLKLGLFIAIIIVSQTNIAKKEDKKNRDLKEELVANNEELIAMNEEMASINEHLRETTEKLNETLNTQKLFTASMNHELRAPLNAVMGGIQLLKEADNLTDEQKNIIDASDYSATNLLHIVNDLLDYAKIEAGEFQITKERFDLNEIIRALTMLHGALAKEKSIDFIVNIMPGIATYLYGDGTRIQQVITNLLSNAVKYTHSGSVTMSIDVANNKLKVIVKDTGEGISDEAMEVLFTPFKRINESKHKAIQGTGLGLYVTDRLVNQMGGTIEVDSTLGEGTTFTVTIPVEIANDADVKQQTIVNDFDDSEEFDFTDKVFLCVDDNPLNLRIFEQLVIKTMGATVKPVNSGKKALQVLEERKFDLIFLDSMMPELSGEETLLKIREAGITTKVVVLTGETGVDNETRFKKIGFDGYLAKPVDAKLMHEVARQLLK